MQLWDNLCNRLTWGQASYIGAQSDFHPEKFGQLLDKAQREPVLITRHGRTAAYVISPEKMHALQAARSGATQQAQREWARACAQGWNDFGSQCGSAFVDDEGRAARPVRMDSQNVDVPIGEPSRTSRTSFGSAFVGVIPLNRRAVASSIAQQGIHRRTLSISWVSVGLRFRGVFGGVVIRERAASRVDSDQPKGFSSWTR
ncbi:type II toxin-antitoxin system Phd/YefM family antitoxin [Variovorax sp. J22R133]|uniref:type II toxin-antitoxin system Phd/YefM family antitoxin n=1 Tax=Variovorax brevis TaxID=3053503 RepID=UPI002577A1B0|nr:type II toxin-antitoxin system Phd/YefM family antitoxin [Variovorax sp. J22R133]MDM0116397.1 type II toxin-antitoxin system Phd/YefM family antitoxin [Variovorax sp. J22R133]